MTEGSRSMTAYRHGSLDDRALPAQTSDPWDAHLIHDAVWAAPGGFGDGSLILEIEEAEGSLLDHRSDHQPSRLHSRLFRHGRPPATQDAPWGQPHIDLWIS